MAEVKKAFNRVKNLWKKPWIRLAVYIVFFYLAMGAFVHSPVYEKLVVRPARGPNEFYKIEGIMGVPRQQFYFSNENGDRLHGWFFRTPDAKKLVIINHGNAGDLTNRLFLAKHLILSGTQVFLYDYRGYGLSSGKAHLGDLGKDALAAYDFISEKTGVKPEDVILYGESIGSGATSQVARQRKVGALIYQSPIDSLPSVAKAGFAILKLYPDWVFLKPHYDNVAYLSGPHPPLLIIHGQIDTLVPIANALHLFNKASQSKSMVVLPNCGHNDVGVLDAEKYSQSLKGFIEKLP